MFYVQRCCFQPGHCRRAAARSGWVAAAPDGVVDLAVAAMAAALAEVRGAVAAGVEVVQVAAQAVAVTAPNQG